MDTGNGESKCATFQDGAWHAFPAFAGAPMPKKGGRVKAAWHLWAEALRAFVADEATLAESVPQASAQTGCRKVVLTCSVPPYVFLVQTAARTACPMPGLGGLTTGAF